MEISNSYANAFRGAYEKLNPKQKKAVDILEGPVLVVAGPGTGKTELLAVRVGNILNKGIDIQAHNILCLTFTDAGAYAMRTRLLKYIGPSAYSVAIHTYHSFCNQVIQENLEYFGSYRELQAISDLEKVDVMMEIIDSLPDHHVLKRFKGSIYHDKGNLENLFQTMKQENWREEDFEKGLKLQIDLLRDTPAMYYSRKHTDKTGRVFVKGDLKEKVFYKEVEKYEKTLAAAKLLKQYDSILEKTERFDFQDIILWVLEQFKNNDELLAKYQERFQYVLLDEYQDTNGAQNELVFQLANYWDLPNLFAVGDDDQSIYRFQGANMNNITDFVSMFNPKVIVLENNYRSSQEILDASTNLISNNGERLVNYNSELTKNLVESRMPSGNAIPPKISFYQNPLQEEIGLLNKINVLIDKGVLHKEIAVIYRNHREVNDIVKYLTLKKVPLNIKRKVNVLRLPIIKQLVNILEYIQGELKLPHSEERRLFEILHYPYFKLSPVDIAKISVYCSRRTDNTEDDRKWREVLFESEKREMVRLSDSEAFAKVGIVIESWISSALSNTLQVLIEKIITSSHWLESILHSEEKTWLLQAFNSFFNLIKDESAKKSDYSLTEFLDNIEKMEQNEIPLPLIQNISNQEGVNFVTAHSSKGLEFKHVFIIKSQLKNWIKNNYRRGFIYPESLVPQSEKSDVEDDRRLFYVAMTRAEDTLDISFSKYDLNDKETEPALFLYETKLPVPDETLLIKEDDATSYMADIMVHRSGKAALIDKGHLDEILKTFKVSATALNKYLKCPLTFYFENILRVPMARTSYMGFGNAIHYALEFYFVKVSEALPDGPLPEKEILIQLFSKGMDKYHSHFSKTEFENHLTIGKKILAEYFDEYHKNWLSPKAYKLEHIVDDVSYAGIPVKGKLDKLIIYDDHVEVIDYKTGKYKAANLKPPLGIEDIGGDYWRQIVFYKILLSSDQKSNIRFGKGTMDFVEKDTNGNFQRKTLPVAQLDEDIVKEQLIETYNNILSHNFDGCGKEECKWCNFVAEVGNLDSPLYDGLEEEV